MDLYNFDIIKTSCLSVKMNNDILSKIKKSITVFEIYVELRMLLYNHPSYDINGSYTSDSVLYLDNFDYIWDSSKNHLDKHIKQQNFYKNFNIEMNNVNCQVEHLQQTIKLLPHMAKKGIIACDDTYKGQDGCWTGKCGAAVTYLLCNDYKIFYAKNHFVILKK